LKLLFLANRVPYPPYRGDKLKIYNLAKRLSEHHELHLLTFAQRKEELEYAEPLKELFKTVDLVYLPKWRSALNCLPGLLNHTPFQVMYFRSKPLRQRLDALLQKHNFDAVHVQHLRMSPYLAANKTVPRILDLPDAFSLYWERRKSVKRGLLRAMFENMEQRRVKEYENILSQYDMALACSSEDLAYLRQTHHADNLQLLPNGVDLKTFAAGNHDYSHNHTLLFTGNMDYAPNIDAVGYFVHDILPLVRQKFPKVQFVIAGQKPVKQVLELAGPGIEVTGFVKDLAAMYNSASVVVAPLRFGAGTQNKVLEAMAMGVPVVCSHIGFGGLGIQSGEGAIMQKEPTDFANSITDLLDSASLRQTIGQAGIQVIRENFDWDIIAKRLEGYFEDILGKRKLS